MAEPGIIMTQSSAEEYLKNKNKYSQAYKNIENQLTQGVNQLEQQYMATMESGLSEYGKNAFYAGKDFMQNISSAYDTAAQQRYGLITSDMGSAARTEGLSDLETITTQAYDTYLQNYMANKDAIDLSAIESSAESEKLQGLESLYQNAAALSSQVNTALESEAKNYQSLYNAPREYFQYLIDNNKISYNTPGFSKYFDVSYRDGVPQYTIKSSKDFDSLFYNFDESGNVTGLSDFGKDFYNQMLYGTSDISGVESFFGWLNTENPDLYNWAIATNQYDTKTTNLGDVFGQLDMGNIINKGTYTGTITSYSNQAPAASLSNAAVDINRYVYDGAKIHTFDNVEYKGLNLEDAADLKSESFKLVDKNGNKYSAKLEKDIKATDDILTSIYNAVGSIEDGKLYAYGEDLYLAASTEDGVVLRKVTFNEENNPFSDFKYDNYFKSIK